MRILLLRYWSRALPVSPWITGVTLHKVTQTTTNEDGRREVGDLLGLRLPCAQLLLSRCTTALTNTSSSNRIESNNFLRNATLRRSALVELKLNTSKSFNIILRETRSVTRDQIDYL